MVFKFGFEDGEESDKVEETGSLVGKDMRAWIVPLASSGLGEGISNANDSTNSSSMVVDEAGALPDAFDVVEMAHGAVHLRKSISSGSKSSVAPNSSDLVPGTYEGGYKLWECAPDLVSYLHKSSDIHLANASVIELGAGHALPALYAAQKGASVVDVTDFNEEVLSGVTEKNIALNCTGDMSKRIRMVAGDWAGIPDALNGMQYDVVLAAEVVYALDSIGRLARCVLQVLKPDGLALIAGKNYYFGVGGGMRAFEKAVQAAADEQGVLLQIDVVEEIRDGRSNVREILRIRKTGKPL